MVAIATLADWLTAEGFATADASAIADVAHVRALLVEAAREGRAVSYSELLGALGLRFTRPKMRAVCKTLDAIDREASMRGEPELAVLVVRESDGLPGQGWWIDAAARRGYAGPWTGPEAAALVLDLQRRAFVHWSTP